MKKITFLVIISISSLFNFSCKGLLAPLTTASSLAATTYYIDADLTVGNDANNGRSDLTPWQTLDKVNSYSFAAGDNVLFKRGERWRGTLVIPSSGSEGNPIVFGAYGDGPLPIIDATTALTDGWTSLGDNFYSHSWVIPDNLLIYLKPSVLVYGGVPKPPVYTLTFADLTTAPAPNDILLQSPWQTMIVTSADPDANTVSGLSIFDGWNTNTVTTLLGAMDPDPATPTSVTPKLSSLTEPGHWYWDKDTQMLYLYSEEPPENVGVEVVSQLYAINSNGQDYITIQDLAVRGGNSAGVILEYAANDNPTSHAILQNLLIYDTGMLYWGAGIEVQTSQDNTISGNEIKSTLKTGILCTGYSIGNTISGNYIHDTGGPGVRLEGGKQYDTAYIIEHNTIGYTNQLNFDSAGIHLQGSGGGNVIRFNEIFNGGSSTMKCAGIMADGNPAPTQFYYNLIYGNTNGGIDLTGSGHEVYNNTLYHNDESQWNAGEIDFFPINTGVSDCTVKNNIIVASDGKPLFHVNNWGFDSTQGHDINYNAYMVENPVLPLFIWGDTVVTSDFDTWKTQSGQDEHSLGPQEMWLNNPPFDFELTSNSPAIDAGTDVGLSNDFVGEPVPQNTSVDIGALEYPYAPSTTTTTIPSSGGGGGGGGGIFGDIIRSQVTGYHLDGYTESGIQIYMPVTKGFKALKGAQEYVRSFAPDLARNVREFFDYLEQKADADKEGLLYQTGTHIFPILGKIAKEGLELIGEGKYISDAYSKTTISIEEFKKLEGRGSAIAPKVVKDFQNQERLFTDMVY